jgi:hypothetical protein
MTDGTRPARRALKRSPRPLRRRPLRLQHHRQVRRPDRSRTARGQPREKTKPRPRPRQTHSQPRPVKANGTSHLDQEATSARRVEVMSTRARADITSTTVEPNGEDGFAIRSAFHVRQPAILPLRRLHADLRLSHDETSDVVAARAFVPSVEGARECRDCRLGRRGCKPVSPSRPVASLGSPKACRLGELDITELLYQAKAGL